MSVVFFMDAQKPAMIISCIIILKSAECEADPCTVYFLMNVWRLIKRHNDGVESILDEQKKSLLVIQLILLNARWIRVHYISLLVFTCLKKKVSVPY